MNTGKRLDSHSLTKKTLHSMGWMFGGTIANVVLQLGFLAVLARYIKPYDYGIVGVCLVVINFSSVLSQVGVGLSLIQRKNINNRHIASAFTFSIATGLAATLIMMPGSRLLASFFEMEELSLALKAIAAVFLIKGFSLVSEAMISREMRFKWIAIRNVISYAAAYGLVGLPMAIKGFGYWSLIFAQVCQEIIKASLLVYQWTPEMKIRIYWVELKELLGFGLSQTVASIFNRCATEGDNVVIGKSVGAEGLGIYGQAYRLMAFPAVLLGEVISKVLFSALSSVQDEKEKLLRAQEKGVFITSFLVIPVCSLIYCFSDTAVYLLLGKQWSGVIPILSILSIGVYFRVGYKINAELAKSVGKGRLYAMSQGAYAFFVVLFCYIGTFWGVEGAALGVTVALGLNFIIMFRLGISVTRIKVRKIIQLHIPGVVCALLILLGGLVSKMYSGRDILFDAVTIITILPASYALTLVIFYKVPVFRDMFLWFYRAIEMVAFKRTRK